MFLLYYDYICKIVLVASSNMEKKSDTYQIATDIQWEFAGEGIVRQIMAYDEHLMMVKVKFNQGAIGTLHQHPHTQSTYVASGCFEVTIGEEKKVLKAGDGYYVAPTFHMVVSARRQVFLSTPSLPCAKISWNKRHPSIHYLLSLSKAAASSR